MFETDEKGKWEVIKGKACKVRLLTKPSQSFLDWQASNSIIEPEPVRDLAGEFDELKTRLKEKGIL